MALNEIVKGVGTRILAETGFAPTEVNRLAAYRLDICETCPIFDSVKRKCDSAKGGCGCYMQTKVYCKECKCPKGKW